MLHLLQRTLLSPKHFYSTSRLLLPWIAIAFIICFSYGLMTGLFVVPADYQQGDGFRIMYVHVPSAFAGMGVYAIMALSAFITLVWRVKIAAICMSCSAPIGASFTFLALMTGSIWGKPMWGTWWIWDARLTSMLILLFLYLGFMALQSVLINHSRRDQAGAVIALAGVINLPIIHYSVIWWNTLHQGPSISKLETPSIDVMMLHPLFAMITAFFLFYLLILFMKMQQNILLREKKSTWVREVFTC